MKVWGDQGFVGLESGTGLPGRTPVFVGLIYEACASCRRSRGRPVRGPSGVRAEGETSTVVRGAFVVAGVFVCSSFQCPSPTVPQRPGGTSSQASYVPTSIRRTSGWSGGSGRGGRRTCTVPLGVSSCCVGGGGTTRHDRSSLPGGRVRTCVGCRLSPAPLSPPRPVPRPVLGCHVSPAEEGAG